MTNNYICDTIPLDKLKVNSANKPALPYIIWGLIQDLKNKKRDPGGQVNYQTIEGIFQEVYQLIKNIGIRVRKGDLKIESGKLILKTGLWKLGWGITVVARKRFVRISLVDIRDINL